MEYGIFLLAECPRGIRLHSIGNATKKQDDVISFCRRLRCGCEVHVTRETRFACLNLHALRSWRGYNAQPLYSVEDDLSRLSGLITGPRSASRSVPISAVGHHEHVSSRNRKILRRLARSNHPGSPCCHRAVRGGLIGNSQILSLRPHKRTAMAVCGAGIKNVRGSSDPTRVTAAQPGTGDERRLCRGPLAYTAAV